MTSNFGNEGIGAINKLLDGEASIDADGDKYIGWEVVCNDDVGEKLAEIFRSMFKLANHQKKSASNLH